MHFLKIKKVRTSLRTFLILRSLLYMINPHIGKKLPGLHDLFNLKEIV